MAEEIITSSEEIEQTTNEISDNVVPLYTDEEIEKLGKDQEKNKFINDNKKTLIGVCNIMLDYLYDLIDRDDNNEYKTLNDFDRSTLESLTKKIEMINKQIKMDAPLADLDFAKLALACQFVGETMRQKAKDYEESANIILTYVDELAK